MSNDSNDNNNGVTVLPGGVLRHQTGGEAAPVAPTPVDGDFGHGPNDGSAYRVDVNGNVTRSGGITRVSSSQFNPQPTTVLSTARGPGGSFRGGPDLLRGGTTVCLHPGDESTRTDIGVALRLGYLQQSQDGNYQEVGTSPEVHEAKQQAAQQQALADSQELFAPAVEQELAKAIAPVDQSVFDAAVVQMVVDGAVDGKTMRIMAEQMKVSPVEAHAVVQKFAYAFHGQAAQAAASAGAPDFAHFTAWCLKNRPEEFKDAQLALSMGRTTQGIKELARDYTRNDIPTADELRASGYKVRTSGGVDIVTLPNGQEMSVGAMVKAGWLRR